MTIWFFLFFQELLVSELCLLDGGICSVPWTATPDMELRFAQMIMKEHGVDQVPVVRNIYEKTYPVGILDPDSINLTCRSCYYFPFIYLYGLYAPFDNMCHSPGKQIFLQIDAFIFTLILKGFNLKWSSRDRTHRYIYLCYIRVLFQSKVSLESVE